MEQVQQNFEKAWQKFETNFKGKLLAKSKKQSITLSLANLILKEASSDWFSGYGAEGKWLSDYKRVYPDRAEAITAILKHELRLGNEAEQAVVEQNAENLGTSSNMKYIVPAAGAVIGAGIASALAAPAIVTMAATALPMVILYSKAKDYGKPAKNKQDSIDGYIAQLQMHKRKIAQVIQKSN
jgi:hypothetical protein